jgi:hypothetical protein
MSQMGVYKLHKLARTGNRFSKDTKVNLERDLHVIQNEYAEAINASSEINGLLYEKDEQATKLYLDKKPFRNVKEFAEFVEVKDDEKEALKAEYLELYGEPAKGTWGVKKLTEEIEKLK